MTFIAKLDMMASKKVKRNYLTYCGHCTSLSTPTDYDLREC